MASFRERIIRFISHENWAGVKNFVAVTGAIAGFLAVAATSIMIMFFPNQFSAISERFSMDSSEQQSEMLLTESMTEARGQANRCRSQMYDALDRGDNARAEVAARCAESNYKAAISEGDSLGHFGLFDLYQDTRLQHFFDETEGFEEVTLLAEKHWCEFASSDQARSLGMSEMFGNIICE